MRYKSINTLAIANRGEIARRIARSARARGLRVCMIYTPEDEGARHLRDGDLALRVPSYLDGRAIVGAALKAGADAVHPGYGFLSENADFAATVLEAGLVWVGPPPDAITAMGSKTEARARMRGRGVPVVPGTEAGTNQELMSAAEAVGFPVLVKASAGGGGKGMRVVREPAALEAALEEARRLAAASFGDDAVFLERYITRARHVEVQVLADRHGHTIHLWERECSIQRRHQKVIEEAPSPAFDGQDERRAALCADAVRAAEAVGYVGAGTVEFVLDPEGRHFFLEMNTRLQVEHPVTELITGLDLVALQLQIAEGSPLPAALRQGPPPARGHAIEARLYAEDPDQDYRPGAGTLLAWEPPPDLRVDGGFEGGDVVGSRYDPLLAKLVAWGEDREQARRRLARGLSRCVALGLPNNRGQLVRVLEHPEFQACNIHTHFLDEHAEALRTPVDAGRDRDAAIAALVEDWLARRARDPLPSVPSGWRNNPLRPQRARLSLGGEERELHYRALDDRRLEVDGVVVQILGTDPLLLEIDGLTRAFPMARDGARVWVHTPEASLLLEQLPDHPDPRDREEEAGLHVRAPTPGRVVQVRASVGDAVERGAVLVVLEAMKMEQPLRAMASGVVRSVHAQLGEQVDAGALLVELEDTAV